MDISRISAVLVTRGDHDLSPVLKSLEDFGELIVWDNSKVENRRVLGRFLGAEGAKFDVVYVQDDDCTVDVQALAAQFRTRELLCNMPVERRQGYRGTGISLIGWGAIFEKPALSALDRYPGPRDEIFERECDRAFTYLNQDIVREVEVSFRQLPYAFGADRMGSEIRHGTDYREIRRRLASLETVRRAA
jgi:hypothetical protein